MTPTLSILLISYLKVSLRCTGMGLQGVCFGVTCGSVQMWYGSPGNQPIPSNSSGYFSLICSLVLTILVFFAVSSCCIMGPFHTIMGLELSNMNLE